MSNQQQIYDAIKKAISEAPKGDKTVTLHMQIIKYAQHLQNISGKEFVESIGCKKSFHTDFNFMRKISKRLVDAGVKVSTL
ncbi:HTH-like domain-containing protein [Yersinia mollaretii]|uniref:HTH-like domain-containing protein n=1 Tax=Yersinia mollaretii TaxID=33060 RepID=UPI0011AAAD14|nr:transcription factor [Yersinia mollaretii]